MVSYGRFLRSDVSLPEGDEQSSLWDKSVVNQAAGFVVLDSAGMSHDAILAYYSTMCRDKKKTHEQLVGRHKTGMMPKIDTVRGFEGDRRVDRLRHLLENGFTDEQGKRIKRSKEQRLIHETYIRTCLPKLYQGEWEDSQERILVQYGLIKLQQETLVVMPRRSGKTWSMAMFCAAMMIVCPDVEVSIFATGARTAAKLLKLIDKMLQRAFAFIGTDEFTVKSQNKEQIILLGPDKTERICGCYPGSVTVSILLLFPLCVCACEHALPLTGGGIVMPGEFPFRVETVSLCNRYGDTQSGIAATDLWLRRARLQ